ncbi:hypothetical protein B0T21DRAFT_370429 [Apiosordaria backusii]|uniref:Uncharacterized protein n=1 Tax=Apiosordaria backusii TaxID=314023 RepID=A0AA40E5N0_9PEZI|nr:hypothetical protein B0T21DRAFT_370429 [Apiosordaria backusii]
MEFYQGVRDETGFTRRDTASSFFSFVIGSEGYTPSLFTYLHPWWMDGYILLVLDYFVGVFGFASL